MSIHDNLALQIFYINRDQQRRLRFLAAEQRKSMSHLIRKAIDELLKGGE
jgi:hypothetical protein